MWTPRKSYLKILILFLKELRKEFLYRVFVFVLVGVFFSEWSFKNNFFFFGLIIKQISSDAIYLYFNHLNILQWILKVFELFCLRWNICNQIKIYLIYLKMYD